MSGNDQYRFAPLFKVRKILLILRWFFGLPLKSRNEAFTEFVFKPCLEWTRYCVYLCCFFGANFYLAYPIMKDDHSDNPFQAIQLYFNSLGFTLLDTLVILSSLCINTTSSIFYLTSFRKGANSISKVCLRLTDLRKELYDVSDRANIKPKQFHLKLSLKLVLFGIYLSGVVSMSFVIIILIILQERILGVVMLGSRLQKCPYLFVCGVFHCCGIYPCITISADFIICHILDVVGKEFSKWNVVLKLYRDKLTEKQMLSNCGSVQAKNVDYASER